MKYYGIDIALLISSVAVIGCGSDEEVLTTLNDAELVEIHELKPITADDISQEEYEAALSLVDNESEDSRFQYSTDENEIDVLERQNANIAASRSGEAFDIMIADFGGFHKYVDFAESYRHDCEYLEALHEKYGVGYYDATEENTCVRETPEHPAFYAPGEQRPMRTLHEYIGLPTGEAAQKALKEYSNLQYVGDNIETHPATGECDPGMFRYWHSEGDVVADARVDQC